jgi:hypothetical protein
MDVPEYAELHFSLTDKDERGKLEYIYVLFGKGGAAS